MSSIENAIRSIQKAKERKDLFLDIGNCNLSELPEELFELEELEELNLSNVYCIDGEKWELSQNKGESNKLKVIPKEITALKNLKKLYLFQCAIDDIEGLAGMTSLECLILDNNNIDDISPLKKSTQLKYLSIPGNNISDVASLKLLNDLSVLNLSNNKIADIYPLENLKQLRKLDLWKNKISDITPLKNLISLENLSIRDNYITDIRPLKDLKSLTCLSLAGNEIDNIQPISSLHLLEYLSIADNKLEKFTESDFNKFPQLKQLFLFNNPISNIPAETLGKNAFDDCYKNLLGIFKPVKIFISYAHQDSGYKNELLSHLSSLKRLNKIKIWEDGQLLAGQNWEPEIIKELDDADVVLCLVSNDFINSEFCYSIELNKAIKAHEAKSKVVIPVFIRACYWENLPFAKIQCIPKTPVSSYKDRDVGWTEVIKGIDKSLKIVKEIKYGT